MKIFRLSAHHPETASWDRTYYCGDLIIRAETEADARINADSIFRKWAPGWLDIIFSPWMREEETSCQEVFGSIFSVAGWPGLLFPAMP